MNNMTVKSYCCQCDKESKGQYCSTKCEIQFFRELGTTIKYSLLDRLKELIIPNWYIEMRH